MAGVAKSQAVCGKQRDSSPASETAQDPPRESAFPPLYKMLPLLLVCCVRTHIKKLLCV